MGMGFAPTWLRQVSLTPLLHKTTLTTERTNDSHTGLQDIMVKNENSKKLQHSSNCQLVQMKQTNNIALKRANHLLQNCRQQCQTTDTEYKLDLV